MPKTLTRPITVVEGFHFDPVAHVYTLNGKPLHGVTTVLKVINKPALIQWSANCACDYIKDNFPTIEELMDNPLAISNLIEEARKAHTKKKEDAASKGTDVHAEIEKIIKVALQYDGKVKEHMLPVDAQKQVREFVQWAIVRDVTFLASEQKLYSTSLWCAGTADFICTIDGLLFVGDVKTSSSIYPEYFIQASAYAKMAEEMELHKGFHGVVIVNTPKKGGLKVEENYDINGNFECFKACLTIHKQLNAITK
jgi:hypothetical protein